MMGEITEEEKRTFSSKTKAFADEVEQLVVKYFPDIGATDPSDVAGLTAPLAGIIGTVLAQVLIMRGSSNYDFVFKKIIDQISETSAISLEMILKKGKDAH